MIKTSEEFMREALIEAEKAMSMGEVPVGAVIVKDDQIIGRGCNLIESMKDPTAHAEIMAIKDAAHNVGNHRLTECLIYVTVEPCAMCAGAIVLARLEKVFIGTLDKKSGACGSLYNIPEDSRLNHRAIIKTGILQIECEQLMKNFFKELREKKK